MRSEELIKRIKAREIDQPLTLYHGSKGGIVGDIKPQSRVRCDFGRGFYMGTNEMQAKSLVSNDDNPYYYVLEFDIKSIPIDRILFLNGKSWLYTVLSCRNANDDFSRLKIAQDSLAKLDKYDVIIGVIADDKMREAMTAFTEGSLTDEGLNHCLSFVDYGLQIVAKTDMACNAIHVISGDRLKGFDLENAIKYGDRQRFECRDIVEIAKRDYADRGHNIFSIINREQERERVNAQPAGRSM